MVVCSVLAAGMLSAVPVAHATERTQRRRADGRSDGGKEPIGGSFTLADHTGKLVRTPISAAS